MLWSYSWGMTQTAFAARPRPTAGPRASARMPIAPATRTRPAGRPTMTTPATTPAPSIDPATVTFTPHFKAQFAAKGFTTAQIKDALTEPYKITDVMKYPGQFRYCGRQGLAIVMDGTRAVTLYEDGVITALRPDQMNDPAALTSRRLNQHR